MELLGKPVVESIYNKIEKRKFNKKALVIQVGDNTASNVYVKKKIDMSNQLGIDLVLNKLLDDVTNKDVISIIEKANIDDNISGIFVQLPLPKHLDEHLILNTISPIKDVDGLTDINLGRLINDKEYHVPCTAQGIVEMLKFYKIPISGKKVTIIGRSNLVGNPLFHLLTNLNATVTLCHSKTLNVREHTLNADIVIVAVGIPKFLTKDMVTQGQTIIDVGINRLEQGLVGDVDFENVQPIVDNITPVPRGVGVTTVACLMENIVKYN